jgi:hypothetical protein
MRPSVPSSRATSLGVDNIASNAATPGSILDRPMIQSRSEPPRRLIDIDMLSLTSVPMSDLKTAPG